MTAVTWNLADKSGALSLGLGDLLAYVTSDGWASARATQSFSSSLIYGEYIGQAFGFGNAAAGLGTYVGADANAFAYNSNGQCWQGGSNVVSWPSYNDKIVCLVFDAANGHVWARAIDGTDLVGAWKGAGGSSGDPDTGSNPQLTGLSGSLFPMTGMLSAGMLSLVNFGARPFFGIPPAAAIGADPSFPATYTAGITWFDVSASSANMALSQANLRAMRAVVSDASYYVAKVNNTLPGGSAAMFEVTVTAATNGGFNGYRVGLAGVAEATNIPIHAFGLDFDGKVTVDSVHVATVPALAFNLGDTITVYADQRSGIKKGWFAKNGVFDGNPSAGTGGFDLSAVSPSVPLRAAVAFFGAPVRAADANFGSMPFMASIPSGGVSYDDAIAVDVVAAGGAGSITLTGGAGGVSLESNVDLSGGPDSIPIVAHPGSVHVDLAPIDHTLGKFTAGADDYADAMANLLPHGPIWSRNRDRVIWRVLRALVPSFVRSQTRANFLLEDAFPSTSQELLPEWEETMGLPDPCAGDEPTLAVRRALVVAKLTGRGGQSKDYFIAFAYSLGFDITITEFRQAEIGDDVGGDMWGEEWPHAWQVNSALVNYRQAEIGSAVAGDPLASWGNDILECQLREKAPAHTTLIFAYT